MPAENYAFLRKNAVLSIVWFLAGYWVFDRLRDSFAEEV